MRVRYSKYYQVAYGKSPYGLRPWKGMVIMTKRAESATSSKKHRKEGGLTQEELEALSGILAKMFRSMSARGATGSILRRGRGFRRGVICLSEGFAFVSGAILRDGAFFLWAASLPVYFAPPGE